MKDKDKTKGQLIKELTELRQRITKLRRIETGRKQPAKKTEAQIYLEQSLACVPDGVLLLDKKARFTYVNPTFLNWLNREAREFIGKTVSEISRPIMAPGTTKIIAERARRRVETGEPIIGAEVEIINKDGKLMPVSYSAAAIKDAKGGILGEVVFIKDMSKYKNMEKEIRKFKSICDNACYGVGISDLKGNLIYVNDRFAKMHGYRAKELIGKNLSIFHNEEQMGNVNTLNEQLKKEGNYINKEVWHKRKDGTVFPTLMNAIVIKNDKGVPSFLCGTAMDISDYRKAEEQIKTSLKEKEVLLKEIHHRVKNNLQIISSLLNLQVNYINDKHSSEIFKETKNRIKTMALVHEKLYQSEDLASIDLADYMKTLVHELFHSYEAKSGTITLNVNVGNIPIDIDKAIPCGLIINELTSNSLKYAFPDGKKGKISINLRLNNNKYILIVRDNGVGFPENLDFRKTESLGLQLVYSLAQQLNGSINLNRNSGTTFKIMFPKAKS